MITRQHSAITFMAHLKKGSMQSFKREIPWALLPDGIRAYSGPRQMSHFEETADGTDRAWMIFPNEQVLRNLSKETFSEQVSFYRPEGYPPCVIGERTDLDTFEVKNYPHQHYHALRMHMVQDIILDNVLREELVEVSKRFKDVFTIRWNHHVIDGATLRKQIAMFENMAFVYLAGKIYEATGKLLNQKWFEENVYEPLKAAYPKDLAENTFKYMRLSEEEDARINALNFDLTADKDGFILCDPDDLEDIFDRMNAQAYYFTAREL